MLFLAQAEESGPNPEPTVQVMPQIRFYITLTQKKKSFFLTQDWTSAMTASANPFLKFGYQITATQFLWVTHFIAV